MPDDEQSISYVHPSMLNRPDLDPHEQVMIAARTPDGPAIRTNIGALRTLIAHGLLEVTPDGSSIRISDLGIVYAREHRDMHGKPEHD